MLATKRLHELLEAADMVESDTSHDAIEPEVQDETAEPKADKPE